MRKRARERKKKIERKNQLRAARDLFEQQRRKTEQQVSEKKKGEREKKEKKRGSKREKEIKRE